MAGGTHGTHAKLPTRTFLSLKSGRTAGLDLDQLPARRYQYVLLMSVAPTSEPSCFKLPSCVGFGDDNDDDDAAAAVSELKVWLVMAQKALRIVRTVDMGCPSALAYDAITVVSPAAESGIRYQLIASK